MFEYQMTIHDFLPFSGELILTAGTLLILLHLTVLSTKKQYPVLIIEAGRLSIILLMVVAAITSLNTNYNSLGDYDMFLMGAAIVNTELQNIKLVLIAIAIGIIFASENYFNNTQMGYYEYYILYLLAVFGCLGVVGANDFLIFYILLEVQGLAFYILAAIKKTATSTEAALKYYLVGSLSSTFLLYGISLIMLLTGHVVFNNVTLALSFNHFSGIQSVELGVLLIMVGMSIKLALAPFHEWVADVYAGIATPTALFFSTIPKITNLILFAKFSSQVFVGTGDLLRLFITAVCLMSLILGCLNALKQQNLKRFLAYGSVNHFGFILMGFLIQDSYAGLKGAFFYLVVYIMLNFGLWGFSCILHYQKNGRTYYITQLMELSELLRYRPEIAQAIILMLFSSGGIPPLAGFVAKLIMFLLVGAHAAQSPVLGTIVVVALGSSITAAYYYLRVVKILSAVYTKSTGSTGDTIQILKDTFGVRVTLYIISCIVVFNVLFFFFFF